MNGLAISASQKLIANRKQWGLQTLHSLNQLLLSSYKKDIYIYIYMLLSCHNCREEKCFPEEGFHKFQHSFYKGISKSEIPRQVGPSTHYISSAIVYLSIYQKQTIVCLRHPRLKQLPKDGISCFHSKLQFRKFLALTKQYQKRKE